MESQINFHRTKHFQILKLKKIVHLTEMKDLSVPSGTSAFHDRTAIIRIINFYGKIRVLLIFLNKYH